MTGEKVNIWNSFVSRFALFFAGLNVAAILISGFLVYDQAAEVITSYSQNRLRHTSNLASKSFYSLLNEVANDIAVTSNNPALNNYINDPTQANLTDLQHLFSEVLKNKPQYFQIRLLDVSNNGKEMVRYDKINLEIVPTPLEKLQFKGDRIYYQQGLKLPRGTYYYSEINLNEEFGTVSYPLTPTLRAVGQVYNMNQELRALLVINLDLSGFYEELNQIMGSESQLMIINVMGDYLFAPDMNKSFGKQQKNNASFNADFGHNIDILAGKNVEYGFVKDNSEVNFLYHIKKLPYSQAQEIYLIALLEENLLFKSTYLVRNDSFKIVILVCLVVLILVFLITLVFSKHITRITQAVSAYQEGDETQRTFHLPEERRDELGVLARSFVGMRRKINQQLADLKLALNREQMAIKERDEFLQNMSHELRTPLNAILGLTELLNKNSPTSNQQPIIDSLQRSATNLSGLMYDILDHQKIMEGKVRIDLSPVNIHLLLSEIRSSYQYEAINKGLTFKLEVEDNLEYEKVLTDELRFNQIVTNLVVNAIKYTDRGGILVTAKTIEAQWLEIIVSDTGKGILPENLQKIKDRFYRETKRIAGKSEGFGLGLSIVLQLVDLLGGTLEVSSQEDQGSQFIVHLPLIKVDTTNDIPPVTSKDVRLPKLNRSYNVLHIEDDPSTVLMVAHLLATEWVIIHQAKNLEQALSMIEEHPPNLIISDLMLDNEVIDASISNIMENLENTPLILLSAFEKHKMQTISPYFFQKPFDLMGLQNLVTVLLGRHEYDTPHLETSYRQYDHNPVKIRNYLTILQKEFEAYVDRIEKAFKNRDTREWQAIMHKITTHIKSLQLEQLSKLIPKELSQLDELKLESIRNILLYCNCVFRYESQQMKPD